MFILESKTIALALQENNHIEPYEPPYGKTKNLHRRKQRRRSDQLCSNCEADQRLCFRYSDSTFSLLLLLLFGNHIVGFPTRRLIYQHSKHAFISKSKTVPEFPAFCDGLIKRNCVIIFYLFVCIEVKRPSQQFFRYVGMAPPLPGYQPVLWGLNLPCPRTQHGATSENCLAQGQNMVSPVRTEPRTTQFRVRCSTTIPHSLYFYFKK